MNSCSTRCNGFVHCESLLANDVRKLQGRPGHRLRVGDWRVIFDEDGVVLAILEIGPRGGACD